MPKIDLFVYDHGSVWTVEAASRRARNWVRDNVAPIESWAGTEKRFTGDWRPMQALVEGAAADGLVVAGA